MGIFDELQGNGATGEYSHSVEPIPDKTKVLAYIEQALMEKGPYDEHELVKLQWRVLKPQEYKDRVVFQKVKVYGGEEHKRVRQLKMLQAIDANAGGGISRSNILNDQTLATLERKPMMLQIGVWEMEDRTGNWVMAVAPKPASIAVDVPKPAPVAATIDDDDDLPF